VIVRMTAGLSGPHYSLAVGDEHEFPDAEAIRLINAGYAVPVRGTQVELAVQPSPPEAEGRRPRSRRGAE